ncbi:hypothetical protein HO173_009010 [Letharia columbiana]|uniref:Alpha/beta hydrolase fold-3 domain-containing protein n=1 Tax=Letharia columbiana TaxID=112416 RepID=A0A8H6FQL0_9LECA|nr:uncharacterized protein HO173_009010 [Letharia columbiana]KAF6232796.1 hypothetical protein HO173_009010 [Letharia columbiana]
MAVIKPELSLLEKATLILSILRVLGVGLITLFTALFRGRSGSAKYGSHVKLTLLRTWLNTATVRHQQYLLPDLDVAYPAFAKERGFPPKDVTLPDGTKAYWLGSPSAEKVILWFHGGGFNLPAEPGHLTFVNSLTSPSVSALILSYTLAPHAIYPRQLQQAVELLRHVITSLHHQPESIIIGGDSAGGNIAVGILSHLLHPHPEIEPLRFEDGAKLRAAILLAPWASFRHDWPSSKNNTSKDLVTDKVGDKWSMAFLGGQKREGYNEPLAAEEGWWLGLEGVVKECLVLGGADELLADSIRELGRRFAAVHEGVTVVIAEGEWHDKPVTSSLGMGGEQDAAIRSFVKSRT